VKRSTEPNDDGDIPNYILFQKSMFVSRKSDNKSLFSEVSPGSTAREPPSVREYEVDKSFECHVKLSINERSWVELGQLYC